METLAGKIIAGTFVAVALYLVVKNPTGDSAAANSISGAYNSGVQALQGR